MTGRLNIVRIRVRNVPRIHGHERVDDDGSLCNSRKVMVLRARCTARHHVETQRNRIWTTCTCLAVASRQESYRNSMPSSL